MYIGLGQIEVPSEKITALRSALRQATQSPWIKARSLASVIGKIISMGFAFGPVSRFMTRGLYAVLESRNVWCDMLTLSAEAVEELTFWSSSWKATTHSLFGAPHRLLG